MATRSPAVCSGVADCQLEVVADIDGNGVRDQIAVVGRLTYNQYEGFYWDYEAKPILRILLGTRVVTYMVPLDGPAFGHLVRGVAGLDGVPGDEVLVGYADGAHGIQQTVVTLRRGRLVPLASPDPYSGSPKDVIGAWGADASIRSYLGWHCLSGGRVEEFTGEGVDAAKGGVDYTLTHRTWRWTSSGWRPITPLVTRRHRPASEVTDKYTDWTGCGTFSKDRPYPDDAA